MFHIFFIFSNLLYEIQYLLYLFEKYIFLKKINMHKLNMSKERENNNCRNCIQSSIGTRVCMHAHTYTQIHLSSFPGSETVLCPCLIWERF